MDFDFKPAAKPTFYFVGVTTARSSIMKVFPAWSRHLGLGDCPIRGIDCKWHDDPAVYRKVVDFLKNDALSRGALVTTHKLDLLKAARDLFDWLDPYAVQLEEVSSISKRGGQLRGHAKDPLSSGRSFDAIMPGAYWGASGAEVCILGAGGSSLALTIHILKLPAGQRPSRILVTNRSEKRIDEMKAVHAKMDCPIPVEYYLCPLAAGNDAVVAKLKPGSMVVNATGLGKDAPGSPLTDQVKFPVNGIVWEFNYRGELVFLDQACAQKESRKLTIEDGWVYFVHGWLCVIAEVFDVEIPASGPEFDSLCRIAAEAR
ncbi:MAG: shikimate dehydrogenase [bacterium]